jgi:hypothetical protein
MQYGIIGNENRVTEISNMAVAGHFEKQNDIYFLHFQDVSARKISRLILLQFGRPLQDVWGRA